MEDTEEQGNKSGMEKRIANLLPHQFKKGQSGNPSGRPKGSISLKEWAKNYIQTLTDEERLDFLEGMNKKDVWEMAEGKAESKTDITSGGQPLTWNEQKTYLGTTKVSDEFIGKYSEDNWTNNETLPKTDTSS